MLHGLQPSTAPRQEGKDQCAGSCGRALMSWTREAMYVCAGGKQHPLSIPGMQEGWAHMEGECRWSRPSALTSLAGLLHQKLGSNGYLVNVLRSKFILMSSSFMHDRLQKQNLISLKSHGALICNWCSTWCLRGVARRSAPSTMASCLLSPVTEKLSA